MSFSPPVVGCLLKKACKRQFNGRPRTPPAMPLNVYKLKTYHPGHLNKLEISAIRDFFLNLFCRHLTEILHYDHQPLKFNGMKEEGLME